MERIEVTNKAIKQIALGLILVSSLMGFSFVSLADTKQKNPKVIYSKNTKLDFEGAQIEGELKNPGEFYFQHRPEEKFDSLIKRKKNFHREMMRDVVFSK